MFEEERLKMEEGLERFVKQNDNNNKKSYEDMPLKMSVDFQMPMGYK